MYIPAEIASWTQSPDALIRIVTENASKGNPLKQWSSAIGIITAICGNILISFALNTQRYAHIRLSHEREEQEEKQKQERKRKNPSRSYGTQQSQVVEERAKTNAKSDPPKYTLDDGDETTPLIPSVTSTDKRRPSDESNENEEEVADVKEKSYLKSPIWWAGITMMTLGETGNFLAYGFAPASIVSPLGVVALVSNCLIAPWLLHEAFRWRDALGVVIAVAGCVVVVMSASASNPKLDPDSIWHLITRWEFETYFGITVVLILGLGFASNRFGDRTVLIDLGLMGLFGGYTALSTKGVASLLSNKIWRVITFPITYLLVAVLVFTAVMQIKYVNRALQRFDSTQVIPTQFVLFTLSVIIGSAVLYRDFERTTTEQAAKFVGGCALTFLGVWCLTSGRDHGEEGEDDGDEEDDTINLVDEEGVQPEIRERDDWDRRQSLIAGSSKPAQLVPETALDNELPDELTPANAAAIHSQATSDLPSTTPHPSRDTLKPPPMHATTSEPAVPQLNSTTPPSTPSRPLKRGHSAVDSPPKTMPTTPSQAQTQTQHLLDPNTDSHRLQRNRHSIAGLLPGPLTSPLSSSLSAIVADSLRRGVDHLPSSSIRRGAGKLRRQMGDRTKTTPASLKRHSIASGEMDFEDHEEVDEGGERHRASLGSPQGAGRMRSFSATLGEMFGASTSSGKRRKVLGRDEQDEGGGHAV